MTDTLSSPPSAPPEPEVEATPATRRDNDRPEHVFTTSSEENAAERRGRFLRAALIGAYGGAVITAIALRGVGNFDDIVCFAAIGLVVLSVTRKLAWNTQAIAAGAYAGAFAVVAWEEGNPLSGSAASPGQFLVWGGAAGIVVSWYWWGRRSGPAPSTGLVPWARSVAIGAYVGVTAARLWIIGIPRDREQVMLYICVGLVIMAWGRRSVWRVFTDWLPFALILVVYDYTRGWASKIGFAVHYTPQLEVDKALFGGVVPTVWLQQHFYSPKPHWWQVFVSLTYLSHFIVPFVVAGVLWWRDHKRFVAFTLRFCSLAYLGLTTYILYPAAPPWKASQIGLLPPVRRLAGQGWSLIGLPQAAEIVNKQQYSNTINLNAAVPSLHAAFATIVAVFLWPTTNKWLRPLLVFYPLMMAFTLVFSGEHYVSDILLGWIYVAIVMVGWNLWDKHRARRKSDAREEPELVVDLVGATD